MKMFLSNLLICFALALCGLSAFQWVREARLRTEIAGLNDTIFERNKSIQTLEGNLKRSEGEVARLETLKTQLTDTIKTNRQEILALTKRTEKMEKEIEGQKNQIDVYKDAVERANESIKRQNEDIKKQNEEIKKLAEERNGAVLKFNKMVEQYNDLVKQFNKLQEEAAKAAAAAAAANPPPKAKN